ncbi:hypothetical protein ACFLUV_06925, partial [Elusimicrobiota bacterium]
CENTVDKMTLTRALIPFPTKTVLVVNSLVKSSIQDVAKTNKPISRKTDKKKKNKAAEVLFMLLNSVIISNEKAILMLIMLFIGFKAIKKLSRQNIREVLKAPPRIKYYRWWSLRFLTPLDKCIQALTNKYDQNPLIFNGRGITMPLKKKPAL